MAASRKVGGGNSDEPLSNSTGAHIAATAIAPEQREQWLRDIAAESSLKPARCTSERP